MLNKCYIKTKIITVAHATARQHWSDFILFPTNDQTKDISTSLCNIIRLSLTMPTSAGVKLLGTPQTISGTSNAQPVANIVAISTSRCHLKGLEGQPTEGRLCPTQEGPKLQKNTKELQGVPPAQELTLDQTDQAITHLTDIAESIHIHEPMATTIYRRKSRLM